MRERSFVLEGVRLVADALAAGIPLHLALYAAPQLGSTAEGQRLLALLEGQPGCYAASEKVVAAASDTVTPQGVVAVVPMAVLPVAGGITLVLDALQDPGNVGTLLRSAAAAGVGQVVCSHGTADLYSPKVVRSAMGAHFALPLVSGANWEQIAALLADTPRIYAAVVRVPTPYYAVAWHEPAALLIGSEAHGLCAEALALATHHISIPLVGSAESLNAAIAGSIMLFEAVRQRHTRPEP
jgi:TrmH family RNA methyltransferase